MDRRKAEMQIELWKAQIMALARCPGGHADATIRAVADRTVILTLDNGASAHETMVFLMRRTLERLGSGESLPAALAGLPQTLGDLGAQKILGSIGSTDVLSVDELRATLATAITVEVRRGP